MRRIIIMAVALLFMIPTANAQGPEDSSCPQIVTLALEATNQSCDQLGSNEACYGHVQIEALPRLGVSSFAFEQEGDVASLHDIQTFRLSSMEPETGTWGVALINVMAYLQYAAPEDVTYLLFGDVELENAAALLTTIEVQVRPGYYANARINPYPNAGVLAVLPPGETVLARARNEDSTWLLVELPESRRLGWVFADVLTTEFAVDTLIIADGASTFYGPMQAFSMQTGANDAPCPESPESGLLIQTPEGVAEVTLMVNEITIDMQATAFLQAQPNEDFSIMVVDGWAEVEVNGQRQPVFAGSRVTVALDETGAPSGPPSPPEPYEMASLQSLPVNNLNTPVEVSAPLSEETIASQLTQWESTQAAIYGPTTQTASSAGSSTTGSTTGSSSSTGDTTATDPVTGEPAPPPADGGGDTGDDTSGDTGGDDGPGFIPPGHGGDIPGKTK
ncbi:MAG: hypothetical protein JXN59_04875 [Anaerolineae bacterium]|nr:hypothetical protein [Anaerolineae bacterium]